MRSHDVPFLILGGTTKAASTTLFHHLASHPRICASVRKETYVFVDPDELLMFGQGRRAFPRPAREIASDLDQFRGMFDRWPDPHYVYLEATPHTLTSRGAPQRIRETLRQAKIVFVLREPIARLVSWYRFALKLKWIPEQLTFPKYVENQLASKTSPHEFPPQLRSLREGRYSLYLAHWFAVFYPRDIRIIFFEELVQHPSEVVAGICRFGGLDPDGLADREFRRLNPSRRLRSHRLHQLNVSLRATAKSLGGIDPRIEDAKRRIRRKLEPLYLKVNTRESTAIEFPAALRMTLEDYYREDGLALQKLLDRPVPWVSPIDPPGSPAKEPNQAER